MGRAELFTATFIALNRGDATHPKAVPVNACVLVVEDEDLVRDLAERVLAMHGFRVLTARDGKQAVSLFGAHASEVDLVLLDLTMPSMSGAEVFEAIVRIRPDTRVLLTSGYSEEESIDLLRRPAAVGFLPKPYRVDRLIERVQAALDPPAR